MGSAMAVIRIVSLMERARTWARPMRPAPTKPIRKRGTGDGGIILSLRVAQRRSNPVGLRSFHRDCFALLAMTVATGVLVGQGLLLDRHPAAALHHRQERFGRAVVLVGTEAKLRTEDVGIVVDTLHR